MKTELYKRSRDKLGETGLTGSFRRRIGIWFEWQRYDRCP